MGSRNKWSLLALALLEATSLPLLVLSLTLILSGYTLVEPHTVSKLTGGLISLTVAYKLHLDPVIRFSYTLLLSIHVIAGFTILLNRRVRSKTLNKIFKTIVIVISVYIVYIAFIVEYITP